MSTAPRVRTGVAVALTALVTALALTGCGSSSSSSSDGTTATSEATTTAGGGETKSAYDGPETKIYPAFPAPTEKSGTSFKVGYLQIIGAIPQLATIENGAIAEAKKLGGSIVSVDAELDIQKQAAGFEQLLAQNVDAIVGYPVAAKALAPQLAKAEAAGIPVITTASQADSAKPLEHGITADVSEGYDIVAYENMNALAEEEPGGKFVIMGLAAPVEALEYYAEREKYWGEKLGLQYEGELDTKEDNPEAYAAAATAILGKYPDATIIATYNDLAGLSTSTVVQQSGKSILISGGNGGSEADIEAIKAGKMFSVYASPWRGFGEELVRGAYDAVTGQGLPLPEKTASPLHPDGYLITPENVDEVEATIES